MSIPDTLREKMDLFRSHGRIQRFNNELFTEVAWLQVMEGQNLRPQRHHPLADLHDDAAIAEYMENVAQVIAQCVEVMPDHAAYVAQHCKAGM